VGESLDALKDLVSGKIFDSPEIPEIDNETDSDEDSEEPTSRIASEPQKLTIEHLFTAPRKPKRPVTAPATETPGTPAGKQDEGGNTDG
jgi:hypothetical protein